MKILNEFSSIRKDLEKICGYDTINKLARNIWKSRENVASINDWEDMPWLQDLSQRLSSIKESLDIETTQVDHIDNEIRIATTEKEKSTESLYSNIIGSLSVLRVEMTEHVSKLSAMRVIDLFNLENLNKEAEKNKDTALELHIKPTYNLAKKNLLIAQDLHKNFI